MTLSVVMCNYNNGHYIQQALDGITSQSVPPLELILIDDASTDDSVEKIAPYLDRFPWIQFYQNRVNRGAYQSAQSGLEIAQGDYIYWACSDDQVLPGFFEASLDALTKYPEAGLCCSQPLSFSQDQETLEQGPPLSLFSPAIYLSPQEVKRARKRGFQIAGHTSIYKKEKVIEAGGVIEAIGSLCDWFFSQVISYRYGLIYLSQGLAAKRFHPDALSLKEANDIEKYESLLHLLDLPPYRDVREHFLHFSILNEKRGNFIQALENQEEKGPLLWMLKGYDFFSKIAVLKKLKRGLTA